MKDELAKTIKSIKEGEKEEFEKKKFEIKKQKNCDYEKISLSGIEIYGNQRTKELWLSLLSSYRLRKDL